MSRPIRFLLDTNCWMQLVRDRAQSGDVRALLAQVPAAQFCLSIFTLHSIGTVLVRRGWAGHYGDFIRQSQIGTAVEVVSIPINDLAKVEQNCLSFNLDFDDAYQYTAAELHGLSLVSLDADFDRTPLARLTPAAALQRFKEPQTTPPAPS